jgi:hypothetical protein
MERNTIQHSTAQYRRKIKGKKFSAIPAGINTNKGGLPCCFHFQDKAETVKAKVKPILFVFIVESNNRLKESKS